jgi:hypothetical protein
MEEKNHILEPENYLKQYQENIENLKHDPKLIEFDKLCFEIFGHNEQGKRFLELCKERYLIPAMAARGTATYQLDVMWAEGFKDFIRLIMGCVTSHQQRIQAGTN